MEPQSPTAPDGASDEVWPSVPPAAPRRTGGRRWVAGLAVLLLGLAAVARLASPPDRGDVLEIPPAGSVTPALLSDGTPVFAVHLEDGTVLAVEALAPEVAGPVGAVAGWCPRTEQFIAPHQGLLWDERGRRYPIGVLGRLGPAALDTGAVTPEDDLVTRVVRRVEGQDDPGDPVQIGPRVDVLRTRGAPRPDPEVSRGSRPPDWCRVPVAAFVQLGSPEPVPPERQVVSHAFLAGDLDLGREGMQVVEGTVLVDAEGAWWCPDGAADEGARPPACAGEAVAFAGDGPGVDGEEWALLEGPLLVTVADGAPSAVAVLPETTWRGASLLGTERYTARLEEFSLLAGQLRLTDLTRVDGEDWCWALTSRPVLDVDARVAVGSATTAEDLAELGALDGQPVDLLVDATTCRVLAVTEAA